MHPPTHACTRAHTLGRTSASARHTRVGTAVRVAAHVHVVGTITYAEFSKHVDKFATEHDKLLMDTLFRRLDVKRKACPTPTTATRATLAC